jgi:DUF917 family protein
MSSDAIVLVDENSTSLLASKNLKQGCKFIVSFLPSRGSSYFLA